ncbi:uncharacterized protein F5891DRAFT_1181741 [Suillus fuscotomentosus]|uniref:Uncharacterized protein n=1 Tax=Suillus fuscotomentosus TaxID=1912939 RepID=A0AAD4EJQ4_9AGAM|nr:uncharacterized protein F5891DRAFT_1181741 [Suillus fuscotomentosus]KAG1907465.1 hypothetical protein F5891DRAFT_1181741 [Suillus fuscotomentosus]
MAHWQSYSGQWDLQSHGEGDPSSYLPPHQPALQTMESTSHSFSQPLGNDSGMPHAPSAHNYHDYTYPQEPTCGSQLQPGIIAPNGSHLQDPAGSYVSLQSQVQLSTGSTFNQQPLTANQSEYHVSSNVVDNVPHGPAPTGTLLYLTSSDSRTSQAAFSHYGYHNPSATAGQYQPDVSDLRPVDDTSACADHQPPYSQNPVGGSYNSLVQSEPLSSTATTFQQACSQYLQDGLSNLNATQCALQRPAFPQTSSHPISYEPSTSQATSAYGYHNLPPAGSSQHHPEAFDTGPSPNAYSNSHPPYSQNLVGGSYNTPVQLEPASSTSSVFQQAYSQYPQSAPQGPVFPPTSLYPTPSNPSTSQVASAYDYRDSHPAAGNSNHQPSYLPQDPAGGSYNHLAQSEPLPSTLSTSQQSVDEVLHDGSSNIAQNASNMSTLFPTALDPSTSQAQSSWSALSAPSSTDQEQPGSQGYSARMDRSRQAHRKLEHVKRVISTTSQPYLSSAQRRAIQTTTPLPIESLLVDKVKAEASRLMHVSLLRETLYPTKDRIDELADAALDDAITSHRNDDNATALSQWKLRTEGQGTLIWLKGIIKQVHKDSQGKSCARGLVAGAYDLPVKILFKNTNNIAQSRKTEASVLLSNYDFLDTIVQREHGGQLQSFRVPFGNRTVTIMTEYILIDQGYRQYIPLKTLNDWKPGLRNIFALSATACELEIRQCAETGWFKPVDLYAQGSMTYQRMTDRMNSLEGTDLEEFRGLLNFMHRLLLTAPAVWKDRMRERKHLEDYALAFSMHSDSYTVSSALRTWHQVYTIYQNCRAFAVQCNLACVQYDALLKWRIQLRAKMKLLRQAQFVENFILQRRILKEHLEIRRLRTFMTAWHQKHQRIRFRRLAAQQIDDLRIKRDALRLWTNRVIEIKLWELEVSQKNTHALTIFAFKKWKNICLRHVEDLSLMGSHLDIKRAGQYLCRSFRHQKSTVTQVRTTPVDASLPTTSQMLANMTTAYVDVGATRFPLPKKDAQGNYKIGIMRRLGESIDYSKLNNSDAVESTPPTTVNRRPFTWGSCRAPLNSCLIDYHMTSKRQGHFLYFNNQCYRVSQTSRPPDFHAQELGVDPQYNAAGVENIVKDVVSPFAKDLMKDLEQNYTPTISLQIPRTSLSTNTINRCEVSNSSTGSFDLALTEWVVDTLSFGGVESQTFGHVEWKCLKAGSQVLTDYMEAYLTANGTKSLIQFNKKVSSVSQSGRGSKKVQLQESSWCLDSHLEANVSPVSNVRHLQRNDCLDPRIIRRLILSYHFMFLSVYSLR